MMRMAPLGEVLSGTVSTTVVTSIVTTLVTLTITAAVKAVAGRRSAHFHPILLVRGAGNVFSLVNESGKPLHSVFVQVYGPEEGEYDAPLSYDGSSVLPKRQVHLGQLQPGQFVWVQWTEYRLRREKRRYAEMVRIRDEVDRYQPRRRDDPPPEYSG